MYEEVSRELVVARTADVEFEVRMAMTGFLAGFSGLTRDAYALDLRQFHRHGLGLFALRHTHIEVFARWLEQQGKAKATVARRLSTISGPGAPWTGTPPTSWPPSSSAPHAEQCGRRPPTPVGGVHPLRLPDSAQG